MQNARVALVLLLAMFIVSALIGALISYNPAAAWLRFVFVLVGLCLFVLFACVPEQVRIGKLGEWSILKWTWLILPAAMALGFLLLTDWSSRVGGKIPGFDPFLRTLAELQPRISNYHPNPNVIGGLLAALLPLQIAAFFSDRHSIRGWVSALLIVLTVLGVLLSELRGAWLALIVVVGGYVFWRLLEGFRARGAINRHAQILIFSIVLLIVAIATWVVLLRTPIGTLIFDARSDRVAVWYNSFDLIDDYFFTGLGLGGYDMAYSSYALLVHVPHTAHAHDLYLNLWLQQGLLGLCAFGGLVSVAILPVARATWKSEPVSRWQAAAVVSLAVVLLHGLIDDSFYGYAGKGIPFLFIPFGLLFRQTQHRLPSQFNFRWVGVLAGTFALVVALIAFVPGVRAEWEANLGALFQTQAELSVFRWPQWGIQDELRRSPQIDLVPAIAQYHKALMIDPTNVTANRRLGQIELSRGAYDMARLHLEVAYASAPHQRATRQLLGEVYAVAGTTDRAAELWRSLDVSAGQLEVRYWWYEHINESQRAGWVQQAAQAR